jgi:hypothetical protein
MNELLVILLVLLLVGAIPAWPYSRNWGDGPSGLVGLLLTTLLVLPLLRMISRWSRQWAASIVTLFPIVILKAAMRSRTLPRVIPRMAAALDWLPFATCSTRVSR